MRIPAILATLSLLLLPCTLMAHDDPIESFISTPKEEIETITLDLRYLGPSKESLPDLFITVRGHGVNWNALRAIPEGFDYEVEPGQAKPTFTVRGRDMRHFLRSIVPLINEVRGKHGEPWVSLTVAAGSRSPFKLFRLTFDRHQSQDLFIYIRDGLRADPKHISIINGGAAPEGCETDRVNDPSAGSPSAIHPTSAALRRIRPNPC